MNKHHKIISELKDNETRTVVEEWQYFPDNEPMQVVSKKKTIYSKSKHQEK